MPASLGIGGTANLPIRRPPEGNVKTRPLRPFLGRPETLTIQYGLACSLNHLVDSDMPQLILPYDNRQDVRVISTVHATETGGWHNRPHQSSYRNLP